VNSDTCIVQVKRLELVLNKYKETIHVYKGKAHQLTDELETTAKQLQMKTKEFESLQVDVVLLCVCVSLSTSVVCRCVAEAELEESIC